MNYKTAILSTALFASPLVALAQYGEGRPPIPPPMRGEAGMHVEMRGPGVRAGADASASTTEGMRRPIKVRGGEMGTSTDGRPGMPPGERRMMGARDEMHSSSTAERMHGTSTDGKPPMRAFFARVFHFFGGPEATSTEVRADANAEVTASSTPNNPPPRPAIEFFQRFFGWFR